MNTGRISVVLAAFSEGLGVFLSVSIILLFAEDCNVGRPPSEIAPVFIRLSAIWIISILAPLTQAGLNPARDLGPRFVSYLAGWGPIAIPGPEGGIFLVYVLGPLLGASSSSFIFRIVYGPLLKKTSGECGCIVQVKM